MSMASDQIFDAIEKIAATSSKNEKQALVGEYIKDEGFKRVMVAALNPLIRYGLAKRPETIGDHVGHEFDEETWQLLDDLATRKVTGHSAIDFVRGQMTVLSAKSAELFWRIVKKDLRAGFSESTVNKACKGLIPDFPYMRCSLPKDADLTSWPWATGALSQLKADAMFANVDHEATGLVCITSRQGSPFPIEKFPRLEEEVRSRLTNGFQYHGELEVLRDGVLLERQIGNGILNSVLNGGDFGPGEEVRYRVWDAIPLDKVVTKGKYEAPYAMRFAGIAGNLKTKPGSVIEIIPTRVVKSLKEAYAHAAELMKQGMEGTVIKHPKAIWKDGTSKEQIKLKLEFNVDLRVTAIVPGKEGTKNEGRAGSLACETDCGKLRVDVTVKNEDMRNRVDANPEDWIGRVIEVTANDIHEPSESSEFYSLFLPRMVTPDYRLDKTTADDLDRVIATKEMAILGESIKKEAA